MCVRWHEVPVLCETQTEEGFALEDLLAELGRLELQALGRVKHGDVPSRDIAEIGGCAYETDHLPPQPVGLGPCHVGGAPSLAELFIKLEAQANRYSFVASCARHCDVEFHVLGARGVHSSECQTFWRQYQDSQAQWSSIPDLSQAIRKLPQYNAARERELHALMQAVTRDAATVRKTMEHLHFLATR